jgi:ribosome-binding factor A
MSKAFSRSRRVAEQMQRVLSELIRREVRDPRLGSVTIIDVQLNHDMSNAKVFYSILGGMRNPELTQEIMNDAAKLVRGPLGRALSLRHAPQLNFVADNLIEYGTHLTSVISDAVKNDELRHKDEDA